MAEKQCNLVKNRGGVQYSTSEVMTGDTWIDGKPVYRITLTGTAPSVAGAMNIQIPNLDTLVSWQGFITSTPRIALQYHDESTNFSGYGTSTDKIQIWCAGTAVLSKSYAITVWYTKT